MAQPLYAPHIPASAMLTDLVAIVEKATVSKTLLSAPGAKQVLFAMDGGQELTEHTSPMIATIQVLDGRLQVRVEAQEYDLAAGGWVLMPPNLPHAVKALGPARFLLTMIKEN